MSEMFDGNDLTSIENKILDLKYEKKLQKYKKKLDKRKVVKDIFRIIIVFISNLLPIVFFALLFTIQPIVGIIIGGFTSFLYYRLVLPYIDDHIIKVEKEEYYFTHPHFDYLICDIEDMLEGNKKIKGISKNISILKDISKNIVLTKEEENYLKHQMKDEIMNYVNNNSNIKKEYPDFVANNYESSNKSKLDSYRNIKKLLILCKREKKEEQLEKEKIYLKNNY